MSIKNLVLAVALASVSALQADIPFLWLDAPAGRSNPNDPKSLLWVPTNTETPVTPVILGTPTSTATPPGTATPTSTATPTATPTYSNSPAFTSTVTQSSTQTSTASPSPTPQWDGFDPADNSTGGSTALTINTSLQTVTGRLVGDAGDGVDYFTVSLTSGNTYDFTALRSSGGGSLRIEIRNASDISIFGPVLGTPDALATSYVAPGTGTFYVTVWSSGGPAGYNLTYQDVSGSTPTFTPSNTPSATPSFTVVDTVTSTVTPSGTETATPTWTITLTVTPTSTATVAGGPVLTHVIFDGTPGSPWQLPSGLGQAGGWAAPLSGGMETSPPADIWQDFIDPQSPGVAHLVIHLGWTDGWWSGIGYNWAGWFPDSCDPLECLDKDLYDNVEFWIRGEVGGESGISIAFGSNGGGGAGGISFVGTYTAGPTLTTTWEKVVIPLSAFTWTPSTTTVWEMNMNGGATQAGDFTYYMSDIQFVKY